MRYSLLTLFAAACAASAASADTLVVPSFFVDATSGAGTTLSYADANNSDVLSFTVSGLSFLQAGGTDGVNAAGVAVIPGTYGTGQVLADGSSGFTYGALILTLNGRNSKQILLSTPANGLGSSTPPTSFTVSGTLQDLFQIPRANQLASATITFKVDDTDYTDNSGGFTISAVTAQVPEPASWAMMIAGFGLVGAAVRRTRPSVGFA